MTVLELYNEIGENYSEVYERLGSDELIAKYLKKLVSDGINAKINDAINRKDWTEAFKETHNLKGLGLNMNLTRLAEIASQLCDMFRNGEPSASPASLVAAENREYQMLAEYISLLD